MVQLSDKMIDWKEVSYARYWLPRIQSPAT